MRVSEWSVKMLTRALAYPLLHPNLDLGVSMDQVAMAHVFNESEFRDGIVYMPRPWFNTYQWHHAYEGKKGNLLVHFPGLEDDRWTKMKDWLRIVENHPEEWDVPLQQTHYPTEIDRFWQLVDQARRAVDAVERRFGLEAMPEDVRQRLELLRQVLRDETDREEAMLDAIDALHEVAVKHPEREG